MRILVTGASGFLGSHIAEQFAAYGHDVRLLLRRSSSRVFLGGFEYEEARGDVTDPLSLAAAVEDVDAIVHAAGLIKARSESEFAAANEVGTLNLVRAAIERTPRVRRFIYVSSLAARGPNAGVDAGSVEAPVSAYGRTKLAGEVAIQASALAGRSVVFRMPVIYGPRDPALLPFFRAVRYRIAPLLMGGHNRISVVYVDDAARAVVQATTAEADIGGKTYAPEDGAVYTWRDLLRAVEEAVGRKAFVLHTPPLAYRAAATASALFGRIRDRAVIFTPDKVREMRQAAWVCSAEDLRRDLGWEARVQIAQGARLTADWYQQAGWL